MSNITGSITFYNLTCVTQDKELYFKEGETFTISNTLTITGAADHLIKMWSQSATNIFTIDIDGTGAVDYANIKDSTRTGTKVLATNSTNGGNTIGWFIITPSLTMDEELVLESDPQTRMIDSWSPVEMDEETVLESDADIRLMQFFYVTMDEETVIESDTLLDWYEETSLTLDEEFVLESESESRLIQNFYVSMDEEIVLESENLLDWYEETSLTLDEEFVLESDASQRLIQNFYVSMDEEFVLESDAVIEFVEKFAFSMDEEIVLESENLLDWYEETSLTFDEELVYESEETNKLVQVFYVTHDEEFVLESDPQTRMIDNWSPVEMDEELVLESDADIRLMQFFYVSMDEEIVLESDVSSRLIQIFYVTHDEETVLESDASLDWYEEAYLTMDEELVRESDVAPTLIQSFYVLFDEEHCLESDAALDWVEEFDIPFNEEMVLEANIIYSRDYAIRMDEHFFWDDFIREQFQEIIQVAFDEDRKLESDSRTRYLHFYHLDMSDPDWPQLLESDSSIKRYEAWTPLVMDEEVVYENDDALTLLETWINEHEEELKRESDSDIIRQDIFKLTFDDTWRLEADNGYKWNGNAAVNIHDEERKLSSDNVNVTIYHFKLTMDEEHKWTFSPIVYREHKVMAWRWDKNWTIKQKRYASKHFGFWTDEVGMIDPTDTTTDFVTGTYRSTWGRTQ